MISSCLAPAASKDAAVLKVPGLTAFDWKLLVSAMIPDRSKVVISSSLFFGDDRVFEFAYDLRNGSGCELYQIDSAEIFIGRMVYRR